MKLQTSQHDDGNFIIGKGEEQYGNGFEGDPTPILRIPSKIDDKTIVGVGINAFRKTEVVQDINIEDGIQVLENSSFRGMPDLRCVILPSSLHTIKSNAFDDCYKLENVIINQFSKLKYIGKAAFNTCKNLKSFIIPNSIQVIDIAAFGEIETNFILYYCGFHSFTATKMLNYTTSYQIIVPKNGVRNIGEYKTTQGLVICAVSVIGTLNDHMVCLFNNIVLYIMILINY